MSGTGDCFDAALRLSRELQELGVRHHIVHGIACGQGPIEGIWHWHAWVEADAMALDRSNGRSLAMYASHYRRTGKITAVWKFKPAEAYAQMTRRGHQGPWVDDFEGMIERLHPGASEYSRTPG